MRGTLTKPGTNSPYRDTAITKSSLEQDLSELISSKMVFQFGEFYSLVNDEHLAFRRKKGNATAHKFMKIANKKAKFI